MKNETLTGILITVVVFLFFLFGGFGMGFGNYGGMRMMYGNYGYGMMFFGWLYGILVFVALVFLIVWLAKQIKK